MWHVVTSPRTHCSPSKVSAELRLDHDGEVLQCAEQIVYIYIYIHVMYINDTMYQIHIHRI